MVHQHFMLIPVMTVAENIVLGNEPTRDGVLLDERGAEQRVRELSQQFGLAVDPAALVSQITVGQQQRVEILKALYRGAEILILDEPTAVLTPQEATELFAIIKQPAGRRQVDHLHQPQAERGARDRRPDHRAAPRQDDRDGAARGRDRGVARAGDGRPRGAAARRQAAGAARARCCSRSRTSTSSTTAGSRRCAASRSTVRAGEIVGIAGVDGNGQTELIDAITGLRRAAERRDPRRRPRASARERRARCSTRASATSPRTASAAGSCSSSRSPRTSRSTTTPSRPTRSGAGSSRRGSSSGRASLIREFDVRGGGPLTRAGGLSGGNQQKVVAAREIARDPKVLIAAQPTRGLDVGAIEYLHRRLVEERDEGRAILLISLELEEMLSLSDRILVIYEGRDRRRARRRRLARSRSGSRCSAAGERRRPREARRPTRAPNVPRRVSPEQAGRDRRTLASRISLAPARRRHRRAGADRAASRS